MQKQGVGSYGAAFDWLGVQRAWARTRGSPDVVIAIVDTGIEADHPLLGPNIRSDHPPLPPSDPSDDLPGTHVAGVAAGRHADTAQFSGVAPAARILPVPYAVDGDTQALDLAQAIEYAVERGASIVNVAHGADLAVTHVQRAIQYAATRNALVVCSADGNGEASLPEEAAPNLIRVVAVDAECRPIRGAGPANDGGRAHIAAPGFARVPRGRDGGHGELQGPAVAPAYVSGCAALIKSLNPGWGYHEIKEHLLASGSPRAELAPHCIGGQLLSVDNAVLGPVEHVDEVRALTWSSLSDATLHWKLRYRGALCVNVVALYRRHGDEHWRELAVARAGMLKMTVPAAALRRSSGVLRLACRESNFHADDAELAIH